MVTAVPVLALRPADSPRLNGEDKAHIARLAETETPLPPILVDRRTMRVIDGMHRLMAASLQGRETIDVMFFDGSEADIFLRAVRENVAHGLPLSQADRRAAAERIIASHPHMSDRAIGHSVGLAAKTIATIRKSSSEEIPQSNARVGRDGKVRPLDSGVGRRRAAELLAQQPDASLRDVARGAGISPATVLDVRKRLERGESPVPQKLASAARKGSVGNGAEDDASNDGACAQTIRFSSRAAAPPDPAATVVKAAARSVAAQQRARQGNAAAAPNQRRRCGAAAGRSRRSARALRRHHCAARSPVRQNVARLRPGTGRASTDHRPIGVHTRLILRIGKWVLKTHDEGCARGAQPS